MGFVSAVQILLEPWVFLASSAFYIPHTILNLLRTRHFRALISPSRFRATWFARFWRWAGPQVSSGARPVVLPLLQGRVRHGRTVDETEKRRSPYPPISGTIIEIGPGSGMWASVLGDLARTRGSSSSSSSSSSSRSSHRRKSSGTASTSGNIYKIYGVEPNAQVYGALRRNVVAAGLDGTYEIVPMGIQALATTGKVAKGSIDCIVSVLCLCGIPEPQQNIKELYGYLKPGGRMYVYEHVKCTRSYFMIIYQRILNLFWPTFMGGCYLCRDTGKYLKEAGPWTSYDLAQPTREHTLQSTPHIIGILTK